MKCRRLATWKDEQSVEHKDIVWFGSLGLKYIVRPDLTFANATWEEIQFVVDLGAYTEFFKIGDTKIFDYQGEKKTCRIIGFDHVDNKESHAISLEIVEPIGQYTMMKMSTSKLVDIYQTNLPSICQSIYDNLPTDMRATILTTKKTALFSSFANYNPDDPSMRFMLFSYDFHIYPFSISEINRDSNWQPGSLLNAPYYKEGTLYEYYKTNDLDYVTLTRSGVTFTSPNAWVISDGADINGTTSENLKVGFDIGLSTPKANISPIARWFNPDDKHDNYSDNQQAVVDSLTQRLSVIKRELWYDINYGLPLLDKQKSKVAIDAQVGKIVLAHPEVDSIKDFKSEIINKVYTCSMKIVTKYGDIILTV